MTERFFNNVLKGVLATIHSMVVWWVYYHYKMNVWLLVLLFSCHIIVSIQTAYDYHLYIKKNRGINIGKFLDQGD